MRKLLFVCMMVLATQVTFSQNVANNDPQVSVDNYKHPNKAEYAKQNNLDNRETIQTSEVKVNDNYKQSSSNTKPAQKAYIPSKTKARSVKNVSYKHPYGL